MNNTRPACIHNEVTGCLSLEMASWDGRLFRNTDKMYCRGSRGITACNIAARSIFACAYYLQRSPQLALHHTIADLCRYKTFIGPLSNGQHGSSEGSCWKNVQPRGCTSNSLGIRLRTNQLAPPQLTQVDKLLLRVFCAPGIRAYCRTVQTGLHKSAPARKNGFLPCASESQPTKGDTNHPRTALRKNAVRDT